MNRLFYANIIPGTVLFKRFRVERCLSATDSGAVYLCNQPDSDTKVALKILSADVVTADETQPNAQRELKVAKKIEHPNVVKTGAFYHDELFRAFSMEYVEGGTLAKLFAKRENLSVNKALNLFLQLCEGLKAIHAAGVIHRDLKPENILIDGEGGIRIADFGVAVSELPNTSQETRQIVGTLNYLSPEYIEHGLFDARSDIFALGVIAFEMVTGSLPFPGTESVETLLNRARFDPIPPHVFRPDCPVALSRIILRCILRNPDKRYQAVDQIIADIKLLSHSRSSHWSTLTPQSALNSGSDSW